MYIQPYQVHRGVSTNEGIFTILLISSDNIYKEYINHLQDAAGGSLQLQENIFSMLLVTAICIKLQGGRVKSCIPI